MKQSREKKISKIFENIDWLVFYSFRYFLSRQSIRTTIFTEQLAKAFPDLDPQIKRMIEKELEETFEHDDRTKEDGKNRWNPFGSDHLRSHWEKVRKNWRK